MQVDWGKLVQHRFFILPCILLVNVVQAVEPIEETIVVSSYIDRTLNDIENPLHIIDGKVLSVDATQNLGESINSLLGVSSRDYGSAVGQPVIRGMSGSRVKILTNSKENRDISGMGADHTNDVDLNNVQQIEIVRGPSSLLYAKGTIGGIINIVDSTIAQQDFVEHEFRLSAEAQSVNRGQAGQLAYQGNFSGVNINYGFNDASFNNFAIPHGAVVHADSSDVVESHLDNSDFKRTAQRLGLSMVENWGYVGFSVRDTNGLYGIPFHHEGEHGDEHGDEDGDEDEHGERVFSKTTSRVYTLDGNYIFEDSAINNVSYFYNHSNYTLTEQEVDSVAMPTRFSSQSQEWGFKFDWGHLGDEQKLVLNYVTGDISVVGSESYINPTQSKEFTLGYYLSKDWSFIHADLGFRYDQVNRKGTVGNTAVTAYDLKWNNISFAMSLGKKLYQFLDIGVGVASVQRTPSTIELFINGPHLANRRFEVGNPHLKPERSNNLDLSLNFVQDAFFMQLIVFYNVMDNYIYLLDETAEEHKMHTSTHNGLTLARYVQKNAKLRGYEFEMGISAPLGNGEVSMTYGNDSISGTFVDGGYIPRIVPARHLYRLTYTQDELDVSLLLKDVQSQQNIASNETATDGYQLLNMSVAKSFLLGKDSILAISLFGKNLLNNIARNHSSLVKNEVPLPGRNYGIKINAKF